MQPAEQHDDPHVAVREVSYDEVLDARWDTGLAKLVASVVEPGKGFEVSLRGHAITLSRFRSRVYRYADSKELAAHVNKTGRTHVVRVYAHDRDRRCDMCKPRLDPA